MGACDPFDRVRPCITVHFWHQHEIFGSKFGSGLFTRNPGGMTLYRWEHHHWHSKKRAEREHSSSTPTTISTTRFVGAITMCTMIADTERSKLSPMSKQRERNTTCTERRDGL